MERVILINKLVGFYKKYIKIIIPVSLLLFLLLGYYVGDTGLDEFFKEEAGQDVMLRGKGGYVFINPLLECDSYSQGGNLKYRQINDVINNSVEKLISDKEIEHVSVYYRDLNNGPWVGYNENEKFTPASLLKVPILMAALKKSETKPDVLDEKVVFDGTSSATVSSVNYKGSKSLEKDQSYSVTELLERMIVYSDNQSATELMEVVGENYLRRVYEELSITAPNIELYSEVLPENFMTVREYSSFFRILYNASYLNKESSEKALELLSQTEFKKGLVADLPGDVVVSHKFGERQIENMSQLHDCGIVYTNNPYLICIMTRGNNFEKMEKVISTISLNVFNVSK